MKNKLPLEFYRQEDVVAIAKELIGKVLFSCFNRQVTAGIITETEAYRGIDDRACHAFGGRRTPRTEVMYKPGGAAYVYLCYGMHHLLNVVTGPKDVPHAVLIRALRPLKGLELMKERRKGREPLASGPGTVTQALGITVKHNGLSLQGSQIWIEDHGLAFKAILSGPRIGVDYAGSDADLPYRFFLSDDRSRGKPCDYNR